MGVANEMPTSEVNNINPRSIDRRAFMEYLRCRIAWP